MWRRPPPPFESQAPREWDSGSSSAARLHRRLVKAVRSADDECSACDFSADQLEAACDELRAVAASVDAKLVAVSRLPLAKRQRALLELRRDVDDVEKASLRIAMSAIEGRGHTSAAGGLDAVHSRLDSLRDARLEIEYPALPQQPLRDRLLARLPKVRNRLGR